MTFVVRHARAARFFPIRMKNPDSCDIMRSIVCYFIIAALYTQQLFSAAPGPDIHRPVWCKESVDDFLASKKKAGLSDGSIRELRSQASIFCESLVSEGLSAFADLTPEMVKRFNLHNEHMLPRTKNNYNGGARQFLVHKKAEAALETDS